MGKLRKSLKNAMWLIVAAVCFVTVFGLVMAFDAGAIGGTELSSIAEAYDSDSTKDEVIIGSNSQLAGIGISDINDFIANSAGTNTKEWVIEDNIVSRINENTVHSRRSSIGNSSRAFIEFGSTVRFGTRSTNYGFQMDLLVNYKIDDTIMNLLKHNSGISIKVDITSNHNYTDSGYGKNDGQPNSGINGVRLMYTNGAESATYWFESSLKNIGNGAKTASASYTLNADNNYINLVWYVGAARAILESNKDRYLTINSLTIKYTITFTEPTRGSSTAFDDGSAPIMTKSFVTNSSAAESYSPVITDVKNLPVYYDSIANNLSGALDKITYGIGGNQTLTSYTNKEITEGNTVKKVSYDGTSRGYYKTAQFRFTDTYDYSYTGFNLANANSNAVYRRYAGIGSYWYNGSSWAESRSTSANIYRMCSGIKTVTISDGGDGQKTTFNMWDSSSYGENAGKGIYSGNSLVGCAQVIKIDQNEVEVHLYMFDNASITIVVNDYAYQSAPVKTTFKGIDTVKPENNLTTTNTDVMAANTNGNVHNMQWIKKNTATFNMEAATTDNASNANYSPYLWFYTVKKAATKADFDKTTGGMSTASIASTLFGDYTKLTPIAFTTPSVEASGNKYKFNFDYDFSKGMAKGFGSNAYNVGNPSNMPSDSYTQDVTGSGYYMFSFYAMDATGNFVNTVKNFFVRVDYETPVYSVNLSYVSDFDGKVVDIPASKNGQWSTGETTLTITFDKANISGNTLEFGDNDGNTYYLTFDRALTSQRFISLNGESVSGSSKDLYIYTNISNTNITIEYEDVGTYGAKFIITFDNTMNDERKYLNVAWITAFTSYVGKTTDDVEGENTIVIKWTDSSWKDGVQVLIDRNKPEAPALTDEGGFLKEGANNYSINIEEKQWYTSGYNFPAQLSFDDDLKTNTTYNRGITVYYGIKFVTDAESLLALTKEQGDRRVDLISSIYSTEITGANGNSYFDRFAGTTANNMEGLQTEFPLDLIEARKGGMRVVYSWAVDQAGNYSDISIYYVLADAQEYTISSNVRVNDLLANGSATIAQKNGEGGNATKFKRGETVTFALTFTDNSDDGGAKYVPFRFARVNNLTSANIIDLLLENYTQNSTWTKNSEFANLISFEDYDSLEYVVDSNTTLGALDNTLYFQLAHRKVITYTVTETRVTYTAKPAEVTMTYSDENAKTHFLFRYVNRDDNVLYLKQGSDPNSAGIDDATPNIAEAQMNGDNPVYFVPVIPDTYRVRIYIPKNDEFFVTKDYTSTNGEQTFTTCTIDFTIRNGEARIIVKSGNTVYGDKIDNTVLTYTIENYDGEVTRGSLKLNTPYWGTGELIPVDTYQIVEDEKFYINEYYNITFVPATHRVAPRDVTISTWAQSKPYGDDDKQFEFGVSSAQFDWYTRRGEQYRVGDIIKTVFANFGTPTVESVDGVDYYLFAVSKSYISRAAGERVDTYEYIVNRNMFDIGSNFNLAVQNTNVFTITQRVVVLNVSNQSTVLLSDVVPVYGDIIPSYMLSIADSHLSEEIEALLSGKLSLDPNKLTATDVPAGYTDWEWHNILLASDAGNENIRFELGEDTVYIIYFADAILIKLRSGVTFSVMFGTLWSESLITFSTDKFELTSKQEIPEYDSIEWTVSLRGFESGYPTVGSYAVVISDIKLIKDGQEIEDCFVIADNFNFTVTAAPVVIRPTASLNGSKIGTKTYGEQESVYGIGFEIVTVGGRPVSDYLEAGYTYEQIYNQISGEFVRGWFASTGDFRELGTRNSAATDENGIVVGTDGDYYAFHIGSAFSSGDRNFTIVPEIDEDVRFHILPKEIRLNAANFVGVSKSYDGSTNVNYNRVTAYSIADQLAFASDDLKLAFDARYSDIGSIETETQVRIIFTNLRLEGRSIGNYKLTSISNTSVTSSIFNNDEFVGYVETITNLVRVEIRCIDNTVTDDSEREYIYIYMGTIALFKSDFTVTKAYDNSMALSDGSVSITERADDENRGTSTLYQVWRRGEMQILDGSGQYNGTSVSNNYVINTLILFFPIQGATGLRIVNGDPDLDPNGEYNDSDVRVTATDRGIRVELTNIRASITKRILGVDSFVWIQATDRAYNSEAGVATTYEFSENALASGDTAESVGLTLRARINDTNFDYGTHRIAFMAVGTSSDDTKLVSGNYTIDIEALNNEYYADKAKTVNISRAKLIPNGVFQNKEYDGTTDVVFTPGNGENALTTLQYSDKLIHELNTFTISSGVTYQLSANGKPNENVTESGWHNVLVSGLRIEEEAGNNFLRNYEIHGSRYVGESYRAVGVATSGAVIGDYEILDAMQLTKRKIKVLVNNINIKEKVYDGTRDAEISVSLEGSHIVKEHEEYLEIKASGTFAKSLVNTNVAVTISNLRLVVKKAGGEEYLNNYLLEEYTERRTANIVPRPVAVTASLGTKTYDGAAKISNNLVKFNISGLFENEASGYAVQASGGAYFMDKNVLLDENGNVSSEKLGAVFNPQLKNNRGKSNYTAAYATDVKDGDDYIAYVIDGVMHYGEEFTGESTEGVIFYYSLPTVDKYILLSDSKLAEEAFAADAIVGSYTYNKQEVYAVKSTYTGNVSGSLGAPVTYITGKGTINKKNIYVSSSGIERIEGSTAFTKMYDRTDTFYGKEGVDFKYNADKGIVGLVKGDDVKLVGIQGRFDSADTTANYVIFTASGIAGDDKDNYNVDMDATAARQLGSITKRTIMSKLQDGTMVYGDVVGDIVGNIKYTILGNQLDSVTGENKEYDLELWNNGLYMQIDKFAEMMGLKVEDYKDIITVRYAQEEDGSFYEIASSHADWNKAFLMLSSIRSLPTAKAVFNMSKPAAGTVASSYTLVGGNATNYSFQFVYTSGRSSKMEVVRKNLFIATDGAEYTLFYGENAPTVNLLYLDVNKNYGIASSETLNSVFGKYSPIVRFGVYNVNTGELKEISKYPTLTLDEGEKYVVYIDGLMDEYGNQVADEDVKRIVPNYTLNFGNSFSVVDGKLVMTYAAAKDLEVDASELFVRLPEVTGVSLVDANGNEYHATYDGTNLAGSALVGDIRVGDEIGILGENGVLNTTVNAGVYEGYIAIVRKVAVDENDPNGYSITWVSPVAVTFVVDKASPTLTVEGRSKYFDNQKFEYSVSGSNLIGYNTHAPELSLKDEYVDITYFKQTNGAEFEAVDEMRNAGTYRVRVQLNKAFEEANPNYAAETVYATYTILKLVVNVTISSNGYVPSTTSTGVLLLAAAYESGKTYKIDYTVSMAGSVSNSISISKAQTDVVFASDITGSGRYMFSVEIVDSSIDKNNYNLVSANGILELTTKHISTSNAAVDLDSLVVANRLVANEVYSSSASASDMDLWLKVEQYMPLIGNQASLAAMVRLELYYGSSIVSLNGATATIEVDVPKELGGLDDIAIYMVTAEGGLKRLTDYTVTSDGKIRYTTDYLGDLMFVNLRTSMLPLWAIILIAVFGGFMVLTLTVAAVCQVVKKRRLHQLV